MNSTIESSLDSLASVIAFMIVALVIIGIAWAIAKTVVYIIKEIKVEVK